MDSEKPVARFRTVGMRLSHSVLLLAFAVVITTQFAIKHQSPWLLALVAAIIEALFVWVASGDQLVFFNDRIEQRHIRGRLVIPYEEITKVEGRGGLKIIGKNAEITLNAMTFLRAVVWVRVSNLVANHAPQAEFDQTATRIRQGNIGMYRSAVVVFWAGVVLTVALLGSIVVYS